MSGLDKHNGTGIQESNLLSATLCHNSSSVLLSQHCCTDLGISRSPFILESRISAGGKFAASCFRRVNMKEHHPYRVELLRSISVVKQSSFFFSLYHDRPPAKKTALRDPSPSPKRKDQDNIPVLVDVIINDLDASMPRIRTQAFNARAGTIRREEVYSHPS